MTPIRDILTSARPIEAGFSAAIPADWMQGRTAYGGLSTALALHAAQRCEPDLPPLRSAQISFIGPLAGEVRATAIKLRRGRNAAFIQADVTGDAGLGLRATFVFMAAIDSSVAHDAAVRAPRTPPPADATTHIGPDHFFTGNFEYLDDESTLAPAEWLRWVRLRDRAEIDPLVELMAIGDALPPAAFGLFDAPVPISSLTWIVNVLTPAPATDDGWWLLHAKADRAVDGYSSQRMTIWNAAGEPVVEAMQGVAIFG
ncbi:thioesterase family protein [Sphingomonas qomolangmaensis]|uniref:Thioesterase family protein n=1 Tax=Sphingomonas qomolangmaensis TaxID=2918765 RepID=A0ABY5LBE7_9SPHN|nr:thioesterase family protein [Sphingomonas qomolangmaensis]UUL83348.1 thioesterase family protein [Sphingomonas qomolangmaensis]